MFEVLLGAIVGGALALLGGIAVQVRQDRRHLLGAARLVLLEVRMNQVAVDDFFDSREEASCRHDVEQAWDSMLIHIETGAWDSHAADLATNMDEEVFAALEYVYYGLHRARNPAHPHADREWPEMLRRGERELMKASKKTRFDRWVWRL